MGEQRAKVRPLPWERDLWGKMKDYMGINEAEVEKWDKSEESSSLSWGGREVSFRRHWKNSVVKHFLPEEGRARGGLDRGCLEALWAWICLLFPRTHLLLLGQIIRESPVCGVPWSPGHDLPHWQSLSKLRYMKIIAPNPESLVKVSESPKYWDNINWKKTSLAFPPALLPTHLWPYLKSLNDVIPLRSVA